MKPVFQKAKRIFTGDRTVPNVYALFRTDFESGKDGCVLTLRADNRFAVWLNGTYIPGQQYSDYETRPVVSRLSLTAPALKDGKNRLEILAYCQNEDSSTYRPGSPSLIFEVTSGDRVLAFSGSSTLSTTDTGFVSGAGVEKISGQLSYSFRYDENAAADPVFRPAEELPDLPYGYEERPVRELTVGDEVPVTAVRRGIFAPSGMQTSGERISSDKKLSSETIRESLPSKAGISLDKNGWLTVDFGRETVGYLTFDVKSGDGVKMDIGFGEHLADGGVRGAVGGRNFACSVRKNAGRTRFTYPIKRFAGRYLELHANAPVTVYSLSFLPTEYETAPAVLPQGLTAEERQLFDASVLTLKCCMHEHYEDCPWREQALYAMDSRNQMLFGYDAFSETDMPRASLSLLAQSQRPDGLLELTAPAKVSVNIPSFSLMFVHALSEYYRKTGDLGFIRETMPVVKRIFHAFDPYREGTLVKPLPGYWNFYEWARGIDGNLDGVLHGETPAADQTKPDSLINAFYYIALKAANFLCSAVGEPPLAGDAELDGFRKAYLSEFYRPKEERFILRNVGEPVCPALCQTMAVYAGLCPEDAELSLLSRIGRDEFTPAMTLSHRIFYYESLLRRGMKEEARADVLKVYYPMIKAGATTLWETAEGQSAFDNAGSLCHGWSASPLYVYYRL